MADNVEPYQERRTHIPLDDAGIWEKRALEATIAICQEALEHPDKVGGVVFGIAIEDGGLLLTSPGGGKTDSFLAIAGAIGYEARLLSVLLGRVASMHAEEPPETV